MKNKIVKKKEDASNLVVGYLRTPMRTRTKVFENYGVDLAGQVFRIKSDNTLTRRKFKANGSAKYPQTRFTLNGNSYNVREHIAVYYTHNSDVDKPKSICDKEWSACSEYVRGLLQQSFEVNHIDHNTLNNHPDNLELVTGHDNRNKAKEFYSKK